MGALHKGHTALIDKARMIAGTSGTVVVSIFVNPTQFGPSEDFSKYPRTLAADLKLCRAHGADAVFLPDANSMYFNDASITVCENSLSGVLCGASRPGHFDGVCTVVTKLFAIVEPDVAVFGEKDWQQLAIIRRLVRDLFIPVKIVGVPTVREPTGLALSSRNRYLNEKDREAASQISKCLRKAAGAFASGQRSIVRLASDLRRELRKIPGAALDYAEIMDAETLEKPLQPGRPGRILAAVRFGGTRLIDNLSLPNEKI
jgi:pantoate--beta-alanine ligase